jgi:hypothetical protein
MIRYDLIRLTIKENNQGFTMILNDSGEGARWNMIRITIGKTLKQNKTYIFKGDSSLCIDDLLWQGFNAPDGWRKLKNNLTEVNFRSSCNVSILMALTFGQVIFQFPPTIRRIVRRIESLTKLTINAEAAISFKQVWLLEDILPNYTNIYMMQYIEYDSCVLFCDTTWCFFDSNSRIH